MNFLDDAFIEKQLFPFTLTRSIADIRIGILTIREKWLKAISAEINIDIPSNLLPSRQLLASVNTANTLIQNKESIFINHPWHIFQYNDLAIREDYALLTSGRVSSAISSSNKIISPENVFMEAGAKAEHCMLNASTGPVYIGKNAEIMEGSMIRGPFALCEGAVVKMGSRIYGATTVGPYSVVGGEIKNSVIFGFSNKAHDGYVGDTVIGEWCNLGAGTSTSNVKNNAREVKVMSQVTGRPITVGLKCGLLMGDNCRSAINTSFNTGTVTGVCCNIFGEGLTRSYIPSFSWGGKELTRYEFDKALRDIENWKKLKKHNLTENEIITLRHIFDNS